MRIVKFQMLFAAALFMSFFTAPTVRAVTLSINIGTINFGTGIPDPIAPIGTGTLTGGFDFDTDTREASNVAFLANGTAGGHDGLYDTPSPSIISSTNLRVFKGSGPSTSVLSLNFSSLAPFFLEFIAPLDPLFGESQIGASNVVLGTCSPLSGFPCGIILVDNNTGTLATQAGPGVFVTPLPAALPLFGTGLAVMGFIGWRRKCKASLAV